MPEIIRALPGRDSFWKFCDLAPKARNSSISSSFAQERLEFAKEQLNWIEIWRVFWKVFYGRTGRFNCFFHTWNFVGTEVVHDNNVASSECRYKDLFDIGEECRTVHRALNHERARLFY